MCPSIVFDFGYLVAGFASSIASSIFREKNEMVVFATAFVISVRDKMNFLKSYIIFDRHSLSAVRSVALRCGRFRNRQLFENRKIQINFFVGDFFENLITDSEFCASSKCSRISLYYRSRLSTV